MHIDNFLVGLCTHTTKTADGVIYGDGIEKAFPLGERAQSVTDFINFR